MEEVSLCNKSNGFMNRVGLAICSEYQGAGGIALGHRVLHWLVTNVGVEGKDWRISWARYIIRFEEDDKAMAFKLVFGEYL